VKSWIVSILVDGKHYFGQSKEFEKDELHATGWGLKVYPLLEKMAL
jgi:hypothetical protein